ncbi:MULTISPECIES: carbohydrate ABC transporter permease [Caldilinea]|jgi:multiple sugar transport system permease protein|nr:MULTISPECIES: carbohydrate ABC transporter permease [Caldilinea]GIV73568.1 MAG: sugar ABC transporter permease [Caldilinea sp.]
MKQFTGQPFSTNPITAGRVIYTTPWYQRRWVRKLAHALLVYVLAVPGAILFTLPLLWMLSTALKDPKQIFVYPPQWIPDPILWSNFVRGWNDFLPFNRFLLNSTIITTSNIIGNLISCSLAAFGFARLRARGKNFFFLLVLSTMLLPQEVTVIPQYVLFTRIGWSDTWLPLMVPPWFGWPFFIFLLRQFFMGIPRELDEAARLDGASSLRILWNIILPLSKPALATVVIFAFIGNWNNFLYPLIYIRTMDKQVLAVALNMFRGAYGNANYQYMMAVSLLVLLPVLLVFFFGQRLFVRGIALTGIKG